MSRMSSRDHVGIDPTLESAFGAIVHGDPMTVAYLRGLVIAITDDARHAAVPVERLIVRIKQTARQAGVDSTRDVRLLDAPRTPGDELVAQTVRWTIERYYTDAPRR
jgi:hypothetical protein